MNFEFVESSDDLRSSAEPMGARMKVVGVGGAGVNAIRRMIEERLPGVGYVAVNTDAQALKEVRRVAERHVNDNPVHLDTVQIGKNLTRGLGAGARPDVGRQAAEEDLARVLEAVGDVDLVFITAGMGGGTGTGGAPTIARAIREKGILTIAIVSTPFLWEGTPRMDAARDGMSHMEGAADTVIEVANERVEKVADKAMGFAEALRMADSVLIQATRGISGIVHRSGEINTDFADVKTIMGGGGRAVLGCGSGRGERAALEAAKGAIESPLLDDGGIAGATKLLINIRCNGNISTSTIAEAVKHIQKHGAQEAEVIFGMDFDSGMEDEVQVTVVATGFNHASQAALIGVERNAVLRVELESGATEIRSPSASRLDAEPEVAAPAPTRSFLSRLGQVIKRRTTPSTRSPVRRVDQVPEGSLTSRPSYLGGESEA